MRAGLAAETTLPVFRKDGAMATDTPADSGQDRTTTRRRRYVTIAWLAGVSGVLFIGLIIFMLSPAGDVWYLAVRFGNLPFDQEQWKTGEVTRDGYCVRGAMVSKLLRRHELVGMTQEEIIQLLGPPDRAGWGDPIRDDAPPEACELDYALGAFSGFRVDMDYLTLHFDDNGRVDAWSVWQS